MKTSRTILALVAVGAVALTAALAQAQSIEEAKPSSAGEMERGCEGKWKGCRSYIYNGVNNWYSIAGM